jgi:hypothetical protein
VGSAKSAKSPSGTFGTPTQLVFNKKGELLAEAKITLKNMKPDDRTKHDSRPNVVGEFDQEAHRIAAELVRLHKDGTIRSQADARLYAHLLCDFDAAYTGPVSNTDDDDQPGRYMPTKEQLVRVPRGLTIEERQRFLQKDLDDMAGLKDTK